MPSILGANAQTGRKARCPEDSGRGWPRGWRPAGAILAALVALVLAAPAPASPPVSPSPDAFNFERRAVRMAQLLWHPACDRVELSWEMDTGRAESGTGWAYEGECVVHLNADKLELAYWEPLCTTILHEVGHIAGRGHTESGLMSPFTAYSLMQFRPPRRTRGAAQPAWVTNVTGGNWRCDRSGRPWLREQLRLADR